MAPAEIEWRSNGSSSAKRFKGHVSLCNNTLFVNGSKFRECGLKTAPEMENLQSMHLVFSDGAKCSIKFDSGLDAVVIKEKCDKLVRWPSKTLARATQSIKETSTFVHELGTDASLKSVRADFLIAAKKMHPDKGHESHGSGCTVSFNNIFGSHGSGLRLTRSKEGSLNFMGLGVWAQSVSSVRSVVDMMQSKDLRTSWGLGV